MVRIDVFQGLCSVPFGAIFVAKYDAGCRLRVDGIVHCRASSR